MLASLWLSLQSTLALLLVTILSAKHRTTQPQITTKLYSTVHWHWTSKHSPVHYLYDYQHSPAHYLYDYKHSPVHYLYDYQHSPAHYLYDYKHSPVHYLYDYQHSPAHYLYDYKHSPAHYLYDYQHSPAHYLYDYFSLSVTGVGLPLWAFQGAICYNKTRQIDIFCHIMSRNTKLCVWWSTRHWDDTSCLASTSCTCNF